MNIKLDVNLQEGPISFPITKNLVISIKNEDTYILMRNMRERLAEKLDDDNELTDEEIIMWRLLDALDLPGEV